jgi:ribosomal protein L16
MLVPNRTKFRKVRKGKNRGPATSCNTIAFGEYALQSQENERITSRQIEASRQAMTRYIKRGGQIWIRSFSCDCSAYSPNAMVLQLVAGPRFLPLRTFRNFVRLGTNI